MEANDSDSDCIWEICLSSLQSHLVIKQEDIVWLDARNLTTEHLSKKLSNKFKELFHVTHTIKTHAFKLKIPEDWGHHNVFDNYLLHLAASDLLPD